MAGQSRARCAFCSHETTKGGMGRHFAACAQWQEQIAGVRSGKPQTLIHLRIQDGHEGAFWFDVEARGTATLADVDGYLRAIWLECCGHMSKFSLGGWGGSEVSKSRRIDAVCTDGIELTHIYDFGTESVSTIEAVGSRHAVPLGRRPIILMARNMAPQTVCVECNESASHLCQECQYDWDSPGTLCPEHAKTHPHDEYGDPIKIVNSPRLGLCGYTGPAVPPY